MSDRLAVTLALYGLGLAAWAALAAAAGRRSAYLAPSLLALEGLAILQAALDGLGLLGGHDPPDRAVHVGYVLASVLLLPVVLTAGAPAEERGRWDDAIAAVGCAGMAVVALRLRATWS